MDADWKTGTGLIFMGFARKIRPVPIFLLLAACAAPAPPPQTAAAPQRIVSLIPAVTETLFAIGAGPKVVGVGSYDTYPAEVATRTRVGGLIDPDTERILSLKPDLVFLYGSQEDLARQLRAARIRVETYRHGRLSDIISGIREIGAAVGHAATANDTASAIEGKIAAVRARVASRPRPSTLIIFGREEGTLRGMYASGGQGFIHDMVDAAGGRNVFADVGAQNIQAALESVIARRPDLILEIRAGTTPRSPTWTDDTIRAWSAAPSIPAVAGGRIRVILDERVVVPGPRVAEGIELLEQAIHR